MVLLSRAAASLLARQPKPAHAPPRRAPRLRLGAAQLVRLAYLRAGPLTRPASAPRRACSHAPRPTVSGRAHRVAAMRQRRMPHDSPGLPRPPLARLHLLPPLRSPLHSPALPLCFARTELCSRVAIATAASPAKFAAGAPPLPAIKRTSLRLAPRHMVLATVTPFEQGKAACACLPPSVMAPP